MFLPQGMKVDTKLGTGNTHIESVLLLVLKKKWQLSKSLYVS